MHLDSRKSIPGLHPGLNDLIRVLGKQAHCASRTLIVCEPSCMSSYSESKYHKSCVSRKEARRWETCRPASLWNPVPPETFYYGCFFYRQYPERDLEYRDIEEKYYAMKRHKLDYSPPVCKEEETKHVVISAVNAGSVKDDAGLGGKIYVDRSIPRSGERGAVLDSSTGPGTFKTLGCQPESLKNESSRSKKHALGESGFEGVGLSGHESIRCSELGEIKDILEKSDKETMTILREMLIALKELSVRNICGTDDDAKELSMRSLLRSTYEAESDIKVAAEPPQTESSSAVCESIPSVSWGDSMMKEFDLDSSLVGFGMAPEVQQARYPDPSRNQGTSRSKPSLSRKYDNSSEPFAAVPRKTCKPGKPTGSGPIRSPLDQAESAPRNRLDLAEIAGQSVSQCRPKKCVSDRPESGTNCVVTIGDARLTLPEAFELSSQVADVIVLEMCTERGRNSMISPRRRDQQLPEADPKAGQKAPKKPTADDSAVPPGSSNPDGFARQSQKTADIDTLREEVAPQKSEEISDTSGYSSIGSKMQPPNSQEGLAESSRRALTEGAAAELDASTQDTRKTNKGRKYALLALPILALFIGGIYAVFKQYISSIVYLH